MARLDTRRFLVLLAYALVGWAVCGSIIAVGFAVATEQATLIAHAIGGPIVFGLLAWDYVRRFGHATPLQIAGSFAMFGSVLGTWLPYASILVVSYLVARFAPRARRARATS